MLTPTNFSDLATPQIAQETWQTELPDHLRAAMVIAHQSHAGLEAYVRYLQAADVPPEIEQAVEQATDAMEQVRNALGRAADAAQEWADAVPVPKFTSAQPPS